MHNAINTLIANEFVRACWIKLVGGNVVEDSSIRERSSTLVGSAFTGEIIDSIMA
jgi:hypothetical protein